MSVHGLMPSNVRLESILRENGKPECQCLVGRWPVERSSGQWLRQVVQVLGVR